MWPSILIIYSKYPKIRICFQCKVCGIHHWHKNWIIIYRVYLFYHTYNQIAPCLFKTCKHINVDSCRQCFFKHVGILTILLIIKMFLHLHFLISRFNIILLLSSIPWPISYSLSKISIRLFSLSDSNKGPWQGSLYMSALNRQKKCYMCVWCMFCFLTDGDSC